MNEVSLSHQVELRERGSVASRLRDGRRHRRASRQRPHRLLLELDRRRRRVGVAHLDDVVAALGAQTEIAISLPRQLGDRAVESVVRRNMLTNRRLCGYRPGDVSGAARRLRP